MCRPVNVMRTACCVSPLLRGVRSISHRGSHRKSENKHRNFEMECYLVFAALFYVFLCHSELFHAFSIIKQFPFICLKFKLFVLCTSCCGQELQRMPRGLQSALVPASDVFPIWRPGKFSYDNCWQERKD